MDKAELIAEILAAFDGVSREDGVTLHQTQVLDLYGTPEEEIAARAKDTETRWQDVPESDIRNTDAALSFLDPKGFRYYLPAYMLTYLKYWDIDDENWDDTLAEEQSVFFHLGVDYPTAFADDGYHLPRFTIFNTQQSKAVAHFLKFFVDDSISMTAEFEARRHALSKKAERSDEEQTELEEMNRRHDPGWSERERDTYKIALDSYWGRFLEV